MPWPFPPARPSQVNVPSQEPSRRRTYQPSGIDVAPPLPPMRIGQAGPPPVYVISTYDARPIDCTDFNTQSGSNAKDTGYDGTTVPGTGYETSSVFFDVPQGRVAVLRDWHILSVPQFGPLSASPFNANGSAAMNVSISILVNGNFQLGYSSIRSYALPFGDVFGECYVVAEPGDEIEVRVDGGLTEAAIGGSWYQMLISLHGQLLLAKGREATFEPGTDAVLPVHDGGA